MGKRVRERISSIYPTELRAHIRLFLKTLRSRLELKLRVGRTPKRLNHPDASAKYF